MRARVHIGECSCCGDIGPLGAICRDCGCGTYRGVSLWLYAVAVSVSVLALFAVAWAIEWVRS